MLPTLYDLSLFHMELRSRDEERVAVDCLKRTDLRVTLCQRPLHVSLQGLSTTWSLDRPRATMASASSIDVLISLFQLLQKQFEANGLRVGVRLLEEPETSTDLKKCNAFSCRVIQIGRTKKGASICGRMGEVLGRKYIIPSIDVGLIQLIEKDYEVIEGASNIHVGKVVLCKKDPNQKRENGKVVEEFYKEIASTPLPYPHSAKHIPLISNSRALYARMGRAMTP